jgi:chaperonin GroEL
VVNHRYERSHPESLDSGGEIVRRILQLADRTEDVGAMFLRECLWRVHQQSGDGAVTAAVLFQSVFSEGVRYIAAGGNAMQLRRHLNKGMEVIIEALTDMTVEVQYASLEQLTALAQTISHDSPLAEMLGEILADIGEFGRLEIRPGQTPELRREQVEGMYWERGLMSRQMATDQRLLRSDLADAAVLISDLEINDVRQLMPPLALIIDAGIRNLFIVTQRISDNVIGFLLANNHPDRFQAIAVTTPGYGLDQIGELEDLAVVTGGRPFIKVAGDTFEFARLQDLGRAGRMWADIHNFGVIDGKADPAAVERHLLSLFSAFEKADDPVLREKLRKRIARIQGDSVTLWVGGGQPDAIKARTELAERTAGMLREALMYGVTPGGGAALLDCRPALQRLLADCSESDERAAYQILLRAMEQPMRIIASNAGYDPSAVLARVEQAGPGSGLDATTGQVVAMSQAGILDVASVLKSAVFSAISSAALALTVEVMVQHRAPEQAQAISPMATKRL